MILLLDNYDSFTYNVYQSLARLTKTEIKVVRSKEISLQEVIEMNPEKLIVSPGPGRPEDVSAPRITSPPWVAPTAHAT